MLLDKYVLLPPKEIKINRDERQRTKIDTTDLRDSISKIGVINPIVIADDYTLIAGERRLTACLELGLRAIPCRFASELSTAEAQIIELEENLKRQDLPWQDQVRAIGRLHDLYKSLAPDVDAWTQSDTARAVSFDPSTINTILRVNREIDNPRIAAAAGYRAAANILSRVDERKTADALSDIIETSIAVFDRVDRINNPPISSDEDTPAPILHPFNSILNLDFLTWAPDYTGKPFNFIHCDFPYGLDVFAGEQSGVKAWETYDDSEDTYWNLISCLCQNLDRLLSHSGHIFFWFAMEHYSSTIERLRRLAPQVEWQTYPCIWHKSDNVGILPDPKRGPRRVYETALIGTKGDRLILKPVSNLYSSPTDKTLHHSTKPEPMLRHFFQMFVDEGTRLLDPTCGSGSALRAAESLGANLVLGLERDENHATAAASALRNFRALRKATK